MRSLKVVFFLLAFASVMALAQGSGEATYIRNVCDSLRNTKVTLIAKTIEESNWYGNPQGSADKWKADSIRTKTHSSYKTLELVLKDNAQFTMPYSITANCFESTRNTYDNLTWEKDHWYRDTAKNYATYIYDVHNVKNIGAYDSSNANNFLAMAPNKLPEDDAFGPGEILVSKPFELTFEWWFVGLRYELVYDSIIGGVTSTVIRSRFAGSVGYDSLTAFRAAKSSLDQKGIPDTLKTIRIQAVKVTLVDSRKLNSPSGSSSSVEPPKSSSSQGTNPGTSSSADNPKSSSSQGTNPGTSSSTDKPKSSSSQGANPGTSSSTDKPKSSSSQGSNPGTSSSTDNPKSSSGDSSPIPVVRSEMEHNEIVEVRRLDGSIVKNSRTEKPGIYYVRTAGGTWLKKVVLPK